jgi:TonB family protein
MIYIYHFVSYDTTSIVFRGDIEDKNQSKRLKFPLFNKNDFSTGDNIIIGKPLDPKLVSSMVTSAVAKNPFVSIAGESIQNRMKKEDFIKLVKSYDYPKQTDFIFIGEINTLASQYEVDLKLIDVSTQMIVSAETIILPFESLSNLRPIINSLIQSVIQKITAPFLGYAYVRVDSTSRDKIRWDDISIRPLQTRVGTEIKPTVNEDFVSYSTVPMPLPFLKTHGDILKKFKGSDLVLVTERNGNSSFLAGDYRFKGFLKNNEKPYETNFTVLPGDLNEIHISLPYNPIPKDRDGDGIFDYEDQCPDKFGESNSDPALHGCPSVGTISLTNLWEGVALEIYSVIEPKLKISTLVAIAENKNGIIQVQSEPYKSVISNKINKISILELPIGEYSINSFAMTKEQFPGKHFVNIFSKSDTLVIDKAGITVTKIIENNSTSEGREIVIYFNPFTPTPDEEYRLFLGNSSVPFTIVRNAGEIHLVGISPKFNETIKIIRDGYRPSIIKIKKDSNKTYYVANLNDPLQSTYSDFEKKSVFSNLDSSPQSINPDFEKKSGFSNLNSSPQSINPDFEKKSGFSNLDAPPPSSSRVKFISYDDPPRPKSAIKPVYPEIAQEAGIEGIVVVRAFIDEKGRVNQTLILQGVPDTGLDQAAMKAIRRTNFVPATKRGRPVAAWISIPVNFKLK